MIVELLTEEEELFLAKVVEERIEDETCWVLLDVNGVTMTITTSGVVALSEPTSVVVYVVVVGVDTEAVLVVVEVVVLMVDDLAVKTIEVVPVPKLPSD